MPVSGLIVTLSSDFCLQSEAGFAIRNHPQIEVGPTPSNRMVIVLDTQSSEEDKSIWEWLNQLPGVIFIDVAMVGFEDVNSSHPMNSNVTTT